MKLLDEIIDLLADENGSLNSALLKTKVLMHTIGHAELAEWVNDELNGYAKDKPVPEYRVVGGRVIGNIENALMIQSDVNLPTYHLPKKLKSWLENHELREAMSVLQEMAISETGASLHMPLSPEIGAQIGKGMNGYWVQKCWVEMQPLQIKNGISQVRSRLLDFALNLRDKIGDVEDKEIKHCCCHRHLQNVSRHCLRRQRDGRHRERKRSKGQQSEGRFRGVGQGACQSRCQRPSSGHVEDRFG